MYEFKEKNTLNIMNIKLHTPSAFSIFSSSRTVSVETANTLQLDFFD